MRDADKPHLPKGVRASLEAMAVIYVAVTVLFVVDPDWPILVANKAFMGYDWPVVFFPIEKFWYSLGVSVPGTRAFLAFLAARTSAQTALCIKVLQVSSLLTAALFAWQFLFHTHAPLYALGSLVESIQVVFYLILYRKLPY
jgi:hypothetical protein